MAIMTPVKLWICLSTIGCVLGTVTALLIPGVPSASHAIVTIRVAHLELFWARIRFRDPAVHEAELHLDRAWLKLSERQYEQSVAAAHEALQRVRDIKGGVPWLVACTDAESRAHREAAQNCNTDIQRGIRSLSWGF